MKTIFLLTLLMPSLFGAFDDDARPLQAVQSVDLQRYAGKWYEVARYPNRFQRSCAGNVTAEYTIIEEGKLKVVNTCRKPNGESIVATGEARIEDKQTNAKLKVRFAPSFLSFLPFVWGNYWIIDLDANYEYAVVSEPDRDYLWILSRTPQMDEARYEIIVQTLKEKGFDTAKLVKTLNNQQ